MGKKLWWILGGIVALAAGAFFLFKGEGPEVQTSDRVKKPKGSDKIRGIRNNNPGNIRIDAANNWQGEVPVNTDGEFEQFTDMKWGMRAHLKLVSNYITRLGRETMTKFVSVYSPKSENDTARLIEHYARVMKVGPNDKLPSDKDFIISFALAIAELECGKHQAITREAYERAWDLL